jgi:hypothetical protein
MALVALLLMVLVPCLGFAYRNGILREVWRITVGFFSSGRFSSHLMSSYCGLFDVFLGYTLTWKIGH